VAPRSCLDLRSRVQEDLPATERSSIDHFSSARPSHAEGNRSNWRSAHSDICRHKQSAFRCLAHVRSLSTMKTCIDKGATAGCDVDVPPLVPRNTEILTTTSLLRSVGIESIAPVPASLLQAPCHRFPSQRPSCRGSPLSMTWAISRTSLSAICPGTLTLTAFARSIR